jgi:hypothetical protein
MSIQLLISEYLFDSKHIQRGPGQFLLTWCVAIIGISGGLCACASRPATTAAPTAPSTAAEARPAHSNPGTQTQTGGSPPAIPVVPIHAEAQRASIREAVATHQHPERLSLLAPATPWNSAMYQAHPEQYLDVIEPGRALAPALPGPGIPQLQILGGWHQLVDALGTIPLTAQAAPWAPLTFTSLDRGLFQNGLTSISVQADASGVASASFTATAGTVADVRIIVASPMASGRGRWVISIIEPHHEHAAAPASVPAPAPDHR